MKYHTECLFLKAMSDIKYTFFLPAYKGRFLNEMLSSIQGQTLTNFKVVISDDCSPDDLYSICKPYLSDSRFTYRRNAENMGSKSLVSHWNLLVDMCDTEFLIMASDDDVYEPNFLEEIDKLTVKYPEVDLFRARAKKMNGKGESTHTENKSEEFLDNIHFIHRFYGEDFIACESNYCYRTNRLKHNKGFVDFPLAWFSDDATHFVMSENGCCITQDVEFGFRNTNLQISSIWGDPVDCVKKMNATYDYYGWMRCFMDRFDDSDIKNKIEKKWRNKTRSVIQNHIYHCPPRWFFSFLLRCPSDVGPSKIRILAHYINAKYYNIRHAK